MKKLLKQPVRYEDTLKQQDEEKDDKQDESQCHSFMKCKKRKRKKK